LKDWEVLAIASREERILITEDQDFGELIFSRRLHYTGVIYFRLGEYAELAIRFERIAYVLDHHAAQMDQFMVVTRQGVRVRKVPKNEGVRRLDPPGSFSSLSLNAWTWRFRSQDSRRGESKVPYVLSSIQ
jgi:hypothetical protein